MHLTSSVAYTRKDDERTADDICSPIRRKLPIPFLINDIARRKYEMGVHRLPSQSDTFLESFTAFTDRTDSIY